MDNSFALYSTVISTLALSISALTAWLTLFRRGTVCMTRPTTIFFGPDGGHKITPKIYLRTLIYATSKRGVVVDNMFARLRRGESSQNFNIWVKGDNVLVRGAGVHINESGVECNHHFLLPSDGTSFEFLAGDYVLEIYATLAVSGVTVKLHEVRLNISESLAQQSKQSGRGIYFDWSPDSQRYHSHVVSKLDISSFLKAPI